MKETLKRELNRTYLIISSEGTSYEETYEVEMIIKNEPERILPLHVLRTDGHMELFYEVSAKQNLKNHVQRSKLSAAMIRNLFKAIEHLIKEVKNYLLDMDCIVLDMEHIYMQEEQFYFCYCPWEKREILSAFRELLEEILGNLDYHDTEGVELSYHLYQSVCKGNFCIAEILEEHNKNEKPEVPAGSYFAEEELPLKVREEEAQEHRKKSFLERILKFFLKKEKAESLEQEKAKSVYAEKTEARWEDHKIEEERYYRSFPELPEGNTMILTNVPTGRWILRPILSNYEEFCITGENFLVGKKRDCVDGYIGKDTISRIHSRLLLSEGRLYVSDANSTNGTFVNGESLTPGKETEIFPGDRILFADVEYECYNSL